MENFGITVFSKITKIESTRTSTEPIFYQLTIEAMGTEKECEWLLNYLLGNKRKDN